MTQKSRMGGVTAKRRPPTPRKIVYDLYWIFAARRQQIFEARIAGDLAPWTDDPILQKFKFCNVFRASDRVSQYLIRNVIYRNDAGSSADRLFQIVAFRTFSKMETWEALIAAFGHPPTLADLASGAFERELDKLRSEGRTLYTAAFILCATKAFGYDVKHKNHVALFKRMFLEERAATRLEQAKSLEAIVQFLQTFPLTGQFMSYQIAIDLNYSDIINFDEDDFTQAGPGAMRGIKKAFEEFGDYQPAEIIKWMVDRQETEFRRLALPFNGLFGRRLHAIDCQGLFCELDKYCRQAVPELESNRTRIKALFTPSQQPLALFFPPKWGINKNLKASLKRRK